MAKWNATTKLVHFLINNTTLKKKKALKIGKFSNYNHVEGIKLTRWSTWGIRIASLLPGCINFRANEPIYFERLSIIKRRFCLQGWEGQDVMSV